MHDCFPYRSNSTSFSHIWTLAWPQLFMMFLFFLCGFVETVVAGRISKEVQVAFGVISQCINFFAILSVAVAHGTLSVVSQSLGAGLLCRARRYVRLSLLLGVVFSATIVLPSLVFLDIFLDAIQVQATVRPYVRAILPILLLTLPGFYLLSVTNAVARAYTWVKLPMYSMFLLTVCNFWLDSGLGLGMWGLPRLEHLGIAWGTFTAVYLGVGYNIIAFIRRGLIRRHAFISLRWARVAFFYLFRVSWPSGVMQILWQSAYLVLFAIIASLPVGNMDALAGMSAGIRIEAALFLPGLAFSMTASILVGHYLGAGEQRLARHIGWKILCAGCGFMALVAMFVWHWVDYIVAFVASDVGVATEVRGYLFYNLLAVPFTVGGMILGGIMVGAGATLYNMLAFGISVWLVRIPLAWGLGHIWWRSSDGVWTSMFISQVVQSLLLLYVFQFRDWMCYTMCSGQPGSGYYSSRLKQRKWYRKRPEKLILTD
ncbi:MATE efflux family protein [Desulfovibrionales bacterium]